MSLSLLSLVLQIVNVTRSGDIKFCKAFWAIAENDFVHVSFIVSFSLELIDNPMGSQVVQCEIHCFSAVGSTDGVLSGCCGQGDSDSTRKLRASDERWRELHQDHTAVRAQWPRARLHASHLFQAPRGAGEESGSQVL